MVLKLTEATKLLYTECHVYLATCGTVHIIHNCSVIIMLAVTDAGEESVALCAMCSQSNAAVRWTFLESVDFKLLRLGYTCSYPNGTVIYEEVSKIQ